MRSRLIYLFLFLTACCVPKSQAQNIQYSSTQISEDIHFLQSKLIKKHPNLYLYTSKQEMDALFDDLYKNVSPAMTELEFYGYLMPVFAKIKDGHTLCFPSSKTIGQYNLNASFFPLKIYWNGEKMYVELNYYNSDEIENGAEIISINGVASKEIMDYCLNRLTHDGNNETYPVWVLNNWFNEYYSYFYDHPTEFVINYRLNDAPVQTKTIHALTKQEIFANRAKRYPNRSFSRTFDQKEGNGITLNIDQNSKIAKLTVKEFTNSILKKNYKQNFHTTIAEYFIKIKESGVTDLILDLRNNQGGEIANGRFLLSYLLNQPFKILEGYHKVSNPDEGITVRRNKPVRGPAMGIIQPKSNAFTGKLYILVNGGSFSNSGIVSSALQYYQRGTFIGEETGGNKNVISAYEKSITLPNTQLKIDMSTRQFEIREIDKNTGHGVMPDFTIKPSIEAMIKGRDEVMEYVMKLIKNKT